MCGSEPQHGTGLTKVRVRGAAHSARRAALRGRPPPAASRCGVYPAQRGTYLAARSFPRRPPRLTLDFRNSYGFWGLWVRNGLATLETGLHSFTGNLPVLFDLVEIGGH